VRNRQVPLYCLSNMAASTFAYLRERHEFWHAFRGIVISAEHRGGEAAGPAYRLVPRRAAMRHGAGAPARCGM